MDRTALPDRVVSAPACRARPRAGEASASFRVPAARRLAWAAAGRLALLLCLLAGSAAAGRAEPVESRVETRAAPGLEFVYDLRDRALADLLWPVMIADRQAIMEQLRMFPPDTVRVRLVPTREAFLAILPPQMPADTLGLYLLGRGEIVLRAPRSDPSGRWDLRGVLRHELAHAVIDRAIAQPLPLWLHEGLAVLLSDELDYLDEAQLTLQAVTGRLIPLPVLFYRFPRPSDARTLAYAQAASFVRFLLRRDGMHGIQALLGEMARGVALQDAFPIVYGTTLGALESTWQGELAGRFSYLTLVTSTSVLGGLGIPLLLLAALRRRLQRRRAYRRWELEERAQAMLRGGWGTTRPTPRTEAAAGPAVGSGGAGSNGSGGSDGSGSEAGNGSAFPAGQKTP
jgi:hypothetical protein